MKKWTLILVLFYSPMLFAQPQNTNRQTREPGPATNTAPKEEKSAPPSPSRTLNPDHQVVTDHEVTIKGQKVPYRTTTGTMPVWDDDGKIIASLFYIYYERTDIKDKAPRPLVISFNGGPGTASVWMHIAYTGPRLLNIDDEGYPLQPYGLKIIPTPYSMWPTSFL